MPPTPTAPQPPSPPPTLTVRKVRGMGRGVFAGRAFRAREVIEVCPVIVLAAGMEEESLVGLREYVFKWGKSEDRLAIALGYGSLYNHSTDPNAAFALRHTRDEIVFRAVRNILSGEQILIDYGWDEDDYAAFRRPA